MNKFNKLYEDIFKPASAEEVETRKEQGEIEEFKEFLSTNNIKHEDIKDTYDEQVLKYIFIRKWHGVSEKIVEDKQFKEVFFNKYINIENRMSTFFEYLLAYNNPLAERVIVKLPNLNINRKSKMNDNSYLHIAVMGNSNINMYKSIIDRGLDINVKGYVGETPFHTLLKYNNNMSNLDNKIKFFIDNGADVNIMTDQNVNVEEYAKLFLQDNKSAYNYFLSLL